MPLRTLKTWLLGEPRGVHSGQRVAEWMLASFMLAWGIQKFFPDSTFATPTWTWLAALMDEDRWGAWAVTLALIRMVALWINGHRKITPLVRAASAFGGMMWWSAVMGFLFLGFWSSLPPEARWATTPLGFDVPRVQSSVSYHLVLLIFEGYALRRALRDFQKQGLIQSSARRAREASAQWAG